MEKAIIVGISLPAENRWEIEDDLSELRLLALTAGVEIVDQLLQERPRIDPAYFIGKGKVDELKQMVSAYQASTLIFDDDLSPAQIRNIEQVTGAKVIDRSTLILDIFASHARTREAKTQVELAQLQHLLPRLTRQWTHLSRQVGGIGTKGPGETQLETDRRLIRRRIETLRRELGKIDQRRQTRRKGREGIFKVSLVGYTNVGKSTIMNWLTGAGVLVEDQLFATLDSTVRRMELNREHPILLSDTVGFIRKLPHALIASFRSTLDEVAEADLLLHVADVAHPALEEQIGTVNQVIHDLGAGDKPVLMVFNKVDLLKEKGLISTLKRRYPGSVFVSAARHIRMTQLKQKIIDIMEERFVEGRVDLPLRLAQLVGRIHSLAIVTDEKYTDEQVHIRFRCSADTHSRIARMIRKAHPEAFVNGELPAFYDQEEP